VYVVYVYAISVWCVCVCVCYKRVVVCVCVWRVCGVYVCDLPNPDEKTVNAGKLTNYLYCHVLIVASVVVWP